MFSFWSGSGKQPDDQSNDQSNNQSTNQSANQSTDQSSKPALSAEEIREKRARKLAEQANQSISQSSTEQSPFKRPQTASNSSSNQSISQSVNQSNTNLTSQSTNQPKSQSTNQSTSQSVNHSSPSRAPIQTNSINQLATPTSHSPTSQSIIRTSASTPLSSSPNFAMFAQLPQSLRPSVNQSINQSTSQSINQLQDDWFSELIMEVLQISIEKPKPGIRTSRTFLAEAAREVAEQSTNQSVDQSTNQSANQSINRIVTTDMLDSLLIERLSLPMTPYHSSLVYLISCYKRAYDIINVLTNISNNISSISQSINQSVNPFFPATAADCTAAINQCNTVLERCVSYCGIVLTDEEMTVDPESINQPISAKALNARELLKLLMSDSLLSRPLPPMFMEYLVKLIDEDQLKEIFSPLIDLCGPIVGPGQQQMATSPFDLSRKKVQALSLMAKHAPLAQIIANHIAFIPPPPRVQPSPWMPAQSINHNGWTFQMQSLLGYHMSHAVASTDPAFQNLTRKSRSDVDADQSRLRSEYDEYYAKIVDLFKSLIRDKSARERVCMFFTQIANINSIHIKRRQHGYDDPNVRSSDGLIVNSLRVLLQLAAPIHAKKKPGDVIQEVKFFDVIKLEYTLNQDPQRYLNYANSTRLSASTQEVTTKSAEIDASLLTGFNFSTEIFFIVHEFINLMSPIFSEYMKLMQSVGRMQRDMQRGRASEEEFSALFAQMCSRDTHLQDPAWHSEMCAFYEYSGALIVSHLLKGGEASLIKYFPETVVEAELDYFVWLGQVAGKVLSAVNSNSEISFTQLSTLLVTIAHGDHAMKNPHTRAKVSGVVLALFVPHNKQDAPLAHVLDNHVFRTQLMPALIDLYVEIEFGAGMYYQKFNVRYELTLCLQYLWSRDHYKQQLITMSQDLTHFLLFTNALANDLVYLLDEPLKLLSQIREYQQSAVDPRSEETAEQRREREEAHRQNERQCTSFMQLASSTIAFISQLTASIREPFVTPQLDFCSRFATTLMYYINKLVGPSIASLNVQNKEKYHFAPRDLLNQIMVIFLHLSSSPLFIEKVAADERSYSPEIMQRAYAIINRRGILEEGEKRQFARVIREIEHAHAVAQDWEANIGDVPEQYGDAVLSTLMSDPVMLPTSKMVVDRVTILRHLLNSKTDPFNRAPLSETELIEQPELKAEIEQWTATKKAEYKARLDQQQADEEITMEDIADVDEVKGNSPMSQ